MFISGFGIKVNEKIIKQVGKLINFGIEISLEGKIDREIIRRIQNTP
jgi:hypothetical protein